MNVASQVMKHEDAIIRRRAMELVGEKIKSMGQVTQGQVCQRSSMFNVAEHSFRTWLEVSLMAGSITYGL